MTFEVETWEIILLAFAVGIYFARNEMLQRQNCKEHKVFQDNQEKIMKKLGCEYEDK